MSPDLEDESSFSQIIPGCVLKTPNKLYGGEGGGHQHLAGVCRGARVGTAVTFSTPGRCGWRSGRDSSSDDYLSPGETGGNKRTFTKKTIHSSLDLINIHHDNRVG